MVYLNSASMKMEKFYRLFAFWDTEDQRETLIVGTHGIVKKSNKTPKEEIRHAEQIKRKYFEKT